ncbi:MAG: hypothetical protein ACFE9T_00480 [Promethearchaeota archaeon]
MERIILVYWNKSTGPQPIIQYPPEKSFPPKDLFLKIWAKHELNKENSIIQFVPEEGTSHFTSIIQKFEGEIYFLILDYNKKNISENIIKDSPDILAIISRNLVELINTNKITRAISEAYNTIINYSKLDEEENLISFFQDKIKFTILQILRNGVISKLDLTNILRQEYGFSTINIDLLLISFLQENLIVKLYIPGIKDCYFLINDLSCTRIPPKNLPRDQIEEKVLRKYKKSLIKFYVNYDAIADIKNKTILQTVILNKDVFSLLKILREKRLSVDECLNILSNKEELFMELIEKKFIYEAKGFVYSFSDVHFIKFTPFYIIERITKRYRDKEISLDEYLTHLKLLVNQLEKHPLYIDYEII